MGAVVVEVDLEPAHDLSNRLSLRQRRLIPCYGSPAVCRSEGVATSTQNSSTVSVTGMPSMPAPSRVLRGVGFAGAEHALVTRMSQRASRKAAIAADR